DLLRRYPELQQLWKYELPDPIAPRRNFETSAYAELLSRTAIARTFSNLSATQWRGRFTREKTNGLINERVETEHGPRYTVAGLRKWLLEIGLYTALEFDEALRGAEKGRELTPSSLKPSLVHKIRG